jgi:hypothetical protein
MQDTSPAKKPRDEPKPGRAARTWFEEVGDQPVDEPVIALILLPDEP